MLADGSALTAVPYRRGAFERWEGAPCDGSTELECDASGPASTPTAVFRPFVAGGIKSLAFGLGYQAVPDHFRIGFRRAPGVGFSPVPGLDRLDPGASLVQLPVSVHLLRWSQGAYMTQACDAANACIQAVGGERSLERADSIAATGHFKAPNAGGDFGTAVALSADGATLAVGARYEDSSATGAFAPGDPGWQAALYSGGAFDSGAAYVYRRSDSGAWTVEAFVKAPVAGSGDYFGSVLALSADGGVLAVGASWENSSATGAFAPSDPGWQAALESDGAYRSGATYVYRRSTLTDAWGIEAFVKAPVVGYGDEFGVALALSADGGVMAVGAWEEASASTGVFAPGDAGYQDAFRHGGSYSGAAYVYRRSAGGRWSLEAFVKEPATRREGRFGRALALSADGGTLAVGSRDHPGTLTGGVFAPGDPGYRDELEHGYLWRSGAAYVYRRSTAGRWALEAFIKPPVAEEGHNFGSALALSADGGALAVGARWEHSTATGVFAPGDAGYQAALDNNNRYYSGGHNSGAAYVYRRSAAGRWAIEAFVKALNSGSGDRFGSALALSDDGATLAVGANREGSASAGAFDPADPDRQAALDSDGAAGSGAAYVYRRSADGAWTAGSFLKAPNSGAGHRFGFALALSADGATLAVGAPGEAGAARDAPAPFGDGVDDGVAVSSSGAVYLY